MRLADVALHELLSLWEDKMKRKDLIPMNRCLRAATNFYCSAMKPQLRRLLLILQLLSFTCAFAGANPPAKLKVEESPINRDIKAPISFAPVAKKVGPSVVNIYSTVTIHEHGSMNPLFNDPF